jgi:hypothetical protein
LFEETMTGEPDSTPRRRPPTIELTATEVESEKQASTQQSAAAAPNDERADKKNAPGEAAAKSSAGDDKLRGIGAVGGAAAGAVATTAIMAAIFAGLWIAGVAPSREPAAPASAAPPPPSVSNEISAQLSKIEAALAARQPDQALAERIAATEAQTKSLADALAALNRRVDDVAAAAQNAAARATAAAAAVDATKNAAQASVQRGDLDAVSSRIATLERAVQTLSGDVARHASSADDRAARLSVAAEALRAAVERGAPYQDELKTVQTLGADRNATAALEPFAAGGVPDAAALAHELAALTPALLQASGTAPSGDTFLARLENNAQKLVRVTPVDAPAGDDPASLIARISIDAARADIAGALAAIARLPESLRALAAPWVKTVEARNAAIAASRRLAADALAALGKPAAQ